MQKTIDSLYKPHSFDISTCKIKEINIATVEEKFTVRNVMGMVQAAKKPDEFVVVGGHYDHHVGYSTPNDPAKDSIFNGADDNASEQQACCSWPRDSRAKESRKRSMIFVAFSGEEKAARFAGIHRNPSGEFKIV